jgi:glycosyltransferase involved in cell wall biosynthesis
MGKRKVIIVGKLPPPFIGPAVATNIILNSKLKNEFDLLHLNTTVNKTVEEFGKGKLSKVGKNISIYKKLVRLLRKEKPDLILIPISQTTLGFLKDAVFILIAALFPIKILLQLRGSNFKNWMKSANPMTRSFVRFCFNRTDGMIVLGDNLRQLFEDYYQSNQIFVVPNGCDISMPERSLESDKTQLLYFANFLPSKGIKEVLEALVLLKDQGIDTFELNAVGAWDNEEYKAECLALVNDNQLVVSFHKPKSGSEKWQTFANSDVFIFTPNMPEGHPWVIVEALSAGLPIISTDQGAIVESVINNKNGFILPNSTPKEIAQKIETLLSNRELRESMGKESKLHYNSNFTESKMVEKLSQTINFVLN